MLFCIYLTVFPGSTVVVALDRVPGWGAWMGSALLLLQGTAALCWLLGRHGAHGGLAALLVFLLAWALELAGVTTGMPFGRYYYTGVLQPQILGTVPLAIPGAWLMVAAGAWQIATTDDRRPTLRHGSGRATDDRLLPPAINGQWSVVAAATLVLLLDLQIETIATKINHYWIWRDGGQYYDVPATNFVAWWLAGLAMALLVATILSGSGDQATRRPSDWQAENYPARLVSQLADSLPTYLYLLSTLMFTIVNLARGYTIAGLVGLIVLLLAAWAIWPFGTRQTFFPGREAS
jgi:uncharacterized membrane protein